MNERIKLLAEQAWDATAVSPDFGHPVSFAEKFAELIVKECLAQVRDEVQYITDWDKADQVITEVKKHFGIEE